MSLHPVLVPVPGDRGTDTRPVGHCKKLEKSGYTCPDTLSSGSVAATMRSQ